MEKIVLSAQPRNVFGRKLKAFRKQGQVPAILYGHNLKPMPLFLKKAEFEKVLAQAGTSTLIDLEIENEKPKKVLIHAVQKDPLTLAPIHADLYQVKMTEKIVTEIPLKFVGEAPAVVEMDGTLLVNRDNIEVECLPTDLVHEIEVDISSLKTFDDLIKVADLKIPKGLEVLNDPNEVVASVTPPRSEEELAELEAPVEEKVEEVEEAKKEKKEEETEGEEESSSD